MKVISSGSDKKKTVTAPVPPRRTAQAQQIPQEPAIGTPKPKLLDRWREALRSRHYSRRTEQTYCHWAKRFIFFHSVQRAACGRDGRER